MVISEKPAGMGDSEEVHHAGTGIPEGGYEGLQGLVADSDNLPDG